MHPVKCCISEEATGLLTAAGELLRRRQFGLIGLNRQRTSRVGACGRVGDGKHSVAVGAPWAWTWYWSRTGQCCKSCDQNEMMAGGVEQKNIYQCLFYAIMIPLSGGTVWDFSSQLLKFSGMKRQYNPLLWEKSFCDSGTLLPGADVWILSLTKSFIECWERILDAQSYDLFMLFFYSVKHE